MAQHILVVDDDSLMRRSSALQLEQAGYRSSTAGSAEDALACAARPARLDPAGHRPAGHGRAGGAAPIQAAGIHAGDLRVGPPSRAGHDPGPGVGRRRLHHQALQPRRAAGPHQGGAAPRRSAAGRPDRVQRGWSSATWSSTPPPTRSRSPAGRWS